MKSLNSTIRTILILQAILCIASCMNPPLETPKEGSVNQNDKTAQNMLEQADASNSNAEAAAETVHEQNKPALYKDTWVSKTEAIPAPETPSGMPTPPCMAGGAYDGSLCVCGENKYPAETAVQWTCFGDYLRCLRKEGCRFNDVIYPVFARLKAETVTCGEDDVPENLEGFVCSHDVKRHEYTLSLDLQKTKQNPEQKPWVFDGFSKHEIDSDKVYISPVDDPRMFWIKNENNGYVQDFDLKPERDYWVCAKEQCDCHGITIEKTDICTNQQILGMHLPEYITEKDNTCKDMQYPAKSLHFGYDCRDGQWVCVGKDCQCPTRIKNGKQEYKTIHLGDVCKMKGNVPVHADGKTNERLKNSINQYGCDTETELLDAINDIDKKQCYCGDTYTAKGFQGGCAHYIEGTVYIYCKIDFNHQLKLDENIGLYTKKISNGWDDYDAVERCQHEDDDNDEDNDNGQEEQSDEDQEPAVDNEPSNDTVPENKEADEQKTSDVPANTEESKTADAAIQSPGDDSANANEQHYYISQWLDDEHPICMNYRGCNCKNNKCPMSTACVDGKCIDPVTKSEIRYGDFLPTIQCSEPSACGCSEQKCKQGEWCVAGGCYSEIVSYILRDEVRKTDEREFYHIYGVTPRHPYGVSDSNNPNEETIYNGQAYYGDITISSEIYEAMKNGYGKTDQEIYAVWECCGGEGMSRYESFRCTLANGCPCGKTTCQMGGVCTDGHCEYDQYYIDMMCYTNDNEEKHDHINSEISFEPEDSAIRVDDVGNCVCHGTHLPPKLFNHYKEQYICSDYGWLCTQPCGCSCGDVMCDANALCIAPGVCSEPLPGNEYKKADNLEDCYKHCFMDEYGNCHTENSINPQKQSKDKPLRCGNYNLNNCIKNRNGYCCGSKDENGVYQFNGILDVNGNCCFSGVLDDSGNCDNQAAPRPRNADSASGVLHASGNCCPPDKIDSHGKCHCIEDECGQCCESNTLNASGNCCPPDKVDSNGKCLCLEDAQGLCCDSGVLDLTGDCCPKDAIDDNGKCYIKDVYGQYCKSNVLDLAGKCCPEDAIDDNGKCYIKDVNGQYCKNGVLDDDNQCCSSGVLDKYERCCEDGPLGKDGVCCNKDSLDAQGNCCKSGIENGQCRCDTEVFSKNGKCCPDKYLKNSRGKKICTCPALSDTGECCESGVLSQTGLCCPKEYTKNGQCTCESNVFSDEYSTKGMCCENGIRDARYKCCDTGVLSETGNCCPKWHIGSNGQCLCPTNGDGRCCVLNRFGKCCSNYRIDSNGKCIES